MLDRVRCWTGERRGKADKTGTVIDGPRWLHGFHGPFRVLRVRFDDGGSDWLSETHVERELPNGAGVKA